VSNFWSRTITGLSMVFILLAGLYINHWIFAGLFFIIAIAGIIEFYNLVTSDQCKPQKIYGLIAGIILYIVIVWMQFVPGGFDYLDFPMLPFYLPIPLFFLTFIIEIYRKKEFPLQNIAVTVIGIFYIVMPLALLNVLNSESAVHFAGLPAYLTAYFILVWFNDTGAYLYGKQFGKHKLFERISPKKTWEGTIAGFLVAILTAIGFSFLVKEIALADWLVLAILVVLFGTMGDLAESMLKRSLNVKDSGNILPGHGGILDRFDAIFISAPFVFLYFIIRFL
jgi:phosphatidate cytidylyltransferase